MTDQDFPNMGKWDDLPHTARINLARAYCALRLSQDDDQAEDDMAEAIDTLDTLSYSFHPRETLETWDKARQEWPEPGRKFSTAPGCLAFERVQGHKGQERHDLLVVEHGPGVLVMAI